MGKMKLEDINGLLSKAVEEALGTTDSSADTSSSDAKFEAMQKSILGLSAKMDALAKAAASGFEAPKTTEDILADFGKQIDEKFQNLAKTLKPEAAKAEDDSTAPIPATKGELSKMICDLLEVSLKKNLKPDAPKGAAKEGGAAKPGKVKLAKSIEDMDESDLNDLAKTLFTDEGIQMSDDLQKEVDDAAGNPLTARQKAKRAELDHYFGKALSSSRANALGDEEEDDLEDDAAGDDAEGDED